MSCRKVVAEEMAHFLSALSHPDRVCIAFELQDGELEVSHLREILGISPSRLSQHLSLLKTHHIVRERKDGRRVFYRLEQVNLSQWLLDGMKFIQQESQRLNQIVAALHQVEITSVTQPLIATKKG